MAIPNFIGNVVRLLWCDIPYVGYFLGIDKDQNVILTDCLMYTNFLTCFYKTINYTAQQINYVRLPLCKIIWIGYLRITEDQTKKEIDGIESFNLTKLFHVPHCQVCFKPGERILIQQEESGAAYTLIGNKDCDPRQSEIVPDYVSLLAGKKCALCENGGNAAIKAEPSPSPRPRPQPDYAYNLYNPNFYKALENLPCQNNDGMEPSPDPKNNSAYTASIIPILIEFLVNDSTRNSSQYVNDSLLRLLTEIASNNCNSAADNNLDSTKGYVNNTADMESMDNVAGVINANRNTGFENMEGFGNVGSFENIKSAANSGNSINMESAENINNFRSIDNFENLGRSEVIGNFGYSGNIRTNGYVKTFENKNNFQRFENMKYDTRFGNMSHFTNFENVGNVNNFENVRSGSLGIDQNYRSMISTGNIKTVENFDYTKKTNGSEISTRNMDGNRGIEIHNHNIQTSGGSVTMHNLENFTNGITGGNFINSKNVEIFGNDDSYKNKSRIKICSQNMQPSGSFETMCNFGNAGNVGSFNNTDDVGNIENQRGYYSIRSTCNIKSVENSLYTIGANKRDISTGRRDMNRSIEHCSQNMQPIERFETMNNFENSRNAGNVSNFGITENVESIENERNYGSIGSTGKLMSIENFLNRKKTNSSEISGKNKNGNRFYSHIMQPFQGFETTNNCANARNVVNFENTENVESFENEENYRYTIKSRAKNSRYIIKTNKNEISIKNMDVKTGTGLYNHNMQPIRGFETLNRLENLGNAGNIGIFSNTENVQSFGNVENYGSMRSSGNIETVENFGHTRRSNENEINIENMNVNRSIGLYSQNMQPIGDFETMNSFQNLRGAGNVGNFGNTENVQSSGNEDNYGSIRYIRSTDNIGNGISIGNMDVNRGTGRYSLNVQPIGGFETMNRFENLENAANIGIFSNTENVQSFGNVENYGSMRSTGNIESVENFGYTRRTDESEINIENMNVNRSIGLYSQNMQPIRDFETMNSFQNLRGARTVGNFGNTESVQICRNEDNYGSMGYIRSTDNIRSGISMGNMDVNRGTGRYSLNVQSIGGFETMNRFENLENAGNIGIFSNTENVQSFGNVENYESMRSSGNIETVGNFGHTRRSNKSEINIENINVNRSIGLYSQNMQPIGDFETINSFQNLRGARNVGNFGNTESVQSCRNEDNYGSMGYIRSTDNIRSGIGIGNMDVNRGTGRYSLNVQSIGGFETMNRFENLENAGNIGIFSDTENVQSFGNVENYGSMRSSGNKETVGNFGHTRRSNESEINIENMNVNRSIGLYSHNMQPIGDFETINSFQNLRGAQNVGNFGNTKSVQSCRNENNYGSMGYTRSTDNIRSGISIGNMDVNRGTGRYSLNVQSIGGFETMNRFENLENAGNIGIFSDTENVQSFENVENYESMRSSGNIETVGNFGHTRRSNESEINIQNMNVNRSIGLYSQNMQPIGNFETMNIFQNLRGARNVGNFGNTESVQSCRNEDNYGSMGYIRSTDNIRSGISIGNMDVNRGTGRYSLNVQSIGGFETMNRFENLENAGNIGIFSNTENVQSFGNVENYGSRRSFGNIETVGNFGHTRRTNESEINIENMNVNRSIGLYSQNMQPIGDFETMNSFQNLRGARNVGNFGNTESVQSCRNEDNYGSMGYTRSTENIRNGISIGNMDVNRGTGRYSINVQSIGGFETMNRFENLENAGNIGIFSDTENVQSFENVENYGSMRSSGNIETVGNFGHTRRSNESEINIENMNVNRSIGLYSQNMQPIGDFETMNSFQNLRGAGNVGNFGNTENVQSSGNEDNYGSIRYIRSTDNIGNGISIGNMDVNRGTGRYSLNVQPIGGFETMNRFENLENAANIGIFSNTENVQSFGNVENYGSMRSTGNIESVENFGYTRRTDESEINIENMNVNRSIGLYSQNMQPIRDFETMNSFQNLRNAGNVGNFGNTENVRGCENVDNYGSIRYIRSTDNISGISIGNMNVNRSTGLCILNVQPIGGYETMNNFGNFVNARNDGNSVNTVNVESRQNEEN